jgi:molybdenum cofactor cytidylyltransferase
MDHPSAIAAIVLAAGSSQRFGTANKLLAEIDGTPLVVRVIAAIEDAGIERIVVVTGHEPDKIAAATARRGRRITYNERHARGMGTSIAAGIKALDDDADGALIAQGDMPAVDAALIATLTQRFIAAGGDKVVFPLLGDGRQGNPVIWPRRLFADLRRLSGDKGGKRLIAAEGSAAIAIPVTGDGPAADIDTPDELAAYVATRSSQPS